MAKSKNGGSRSFLRGRIGSDVYSVGKDGKGLRQQVVRSLAVQVSNPRTQSQMFGRMIMSTVMQAVSGLSFLIDHSFDGLAKGQPSISEFIRRNYALVKADAVAHPSENNTFNLSKFQEKGAMVGPYVISDGDVVKPATLSPNVIGASIELTAQTMTVGGLKAALGLSADGYITWVLISEGNGVLYFRAKLTTTLADSTAISAGNVASLFTIEGNCSVVPAIYNNSITFTVDTPSANNEAYGLIVSEYVDGGWKHSACTLTANIDDIPQTADVALPTYPTGTEMFLNGGDL